MKGNRGCRSNIQNTSPETDCRPRVLIDLTDDSKPSCNDLERRYIREENRIFERRVESQKKTLNTAPNVAAFCEVVSSPECSLIYEKPGVLPLQSNLLNDSITIIQEIPAEKKARKRHQKSEECISQTSSTNAKKICCGICFEDPTEMGVESKSRHLVSTVCGHIFCNECLKKAIQAFHKCPSCKKRLTIKNFHPIYI